MSNVSIRGSGGGGVSDGDKGDITVSGGGSTWTLNADSVVGLDVFTDVTNGVVPASGGGTSKYLRADGSWAVPPGGGGGGSLDDALALMVLL